MTWDGAIYNCAFHNPAAGQRRNLTATSLLKQSFAWQDRKGKPPELAGPVLILYGDDEFMKKVRA